MNESLKAVYTGFHFSHGKRRLPQEFLSGREKPGEATERPAAAVAPFGDSPPLRAGQALGRRSLIPIRPHGGADHSAFGASRLGVQGQDHGLVQPSVGIDYRPVMAVEPSRGRSANAVRFYSAPDNLRVPNCFPIHCAAADRGAV